MAARVLLLGILFTEVLRPACPAGVNGAGTRSGSPRSEVLLEGTAGRPAGGSGPSGGGHNLGLDIRPRAGELVLGRKGVTLTCTGSASHEAQISWLYNGVLCEPGRCNAQIPRNGALRVKKKSIVQKRKGREGNGTLSIGATQRNEYRCIARTSYGAYLRSAPVNILYAELSHAFVESPEDLTVREGEVTRLSCSIDSVPFPPNITWLHDGEIVPTDLNKTKYAFILPGVLFIRATKPSDAGSYRCVAVNEYINMTKKSKEAKLIVIPRDEKDSQSPVSLFPQPSYSHTPLNGTNLRLACAASGYPTPTTTWTFVPQYPDTEVVQRKILRQSSSGLSILELTSVNILNSGVYTCSAKNLMNKSTEVQNVTVEVRVPPTFVKKPSSQVCPNGRTARFECQAQGFPTPRIYWLRNSENITINGRRTVYYKESNKVELAISATVPSDSGIYQCVAVNAAGEIWAAGRLQVNASRNSPAAPTSLKCEARSPVKMFISWEPPKFLPSTNITAYTVHYRPVEGGKEEVSPPEPGNSTSVEVTKLLEPFTNYTFYVRLWNNHGASDQSTTINCSTTESVPKAAPKILVNVINSTKLNVTWKPLTKKEAQGIVTEYKLEWRLFQHPTARIKTLPADVEQYILTDLTPSEQYDIRVLARTKQGWPNISESQLGWVSVTMPSTNDFSQIQVFILNSTTVKVKWNIKGNSLLQFTSCKILCKNEDGDTIISVNLTRNSTEYTFTNLEPNFYSFELCALNIQETVHCIIKHVDLKKISSSNVPTALEAIPLSSNSISLTWLSGKSSESSSFEVCYHPVHFLNESITCIPVNSTKVIINNLKPFMLYQFKIRALGNDTDENSFSETIECYTSEDVPGKVQDIQSFTINGTVSVAWKEPSNMNGIIQNYFIAYTSDRYEPRSTWKNITVLGNKTSTSLPDLMPGKRYFVVIQAATKAGFGNPSEPIVVLTGGSSSEVHSTLDEQKSELRKSEKFGIILGTGIGIVFIVIAMCYILYTKRKVRLQSLRESAQPLKSRMLTRNGNGCCVDHSSAPVNHPAVMSNEFELAVLYPSTPISTNPLCDTKGGHANGIIESCAKEPLLAPWEVNGFRKDLRITENPQYKPRESEDLKKSKQQEQQEASELNSTQLTTISNYDLGGSDESLNNNVGRHTTAEGGDALPRKADPTIVPVLEPNG